MSLDAYDIVIGLEIHVQLNTASKLFSSAPSAFGAAPNTQANAVDLALPGVLPVLNAEAVKKAVQFGFAISANVARKSVFDRKNYFYPDLPKGYQISQLHHPIVTDGFVMIPLENGEQKRIDIVRAHMEEDAGKSLHEDFHGMSGIDLNRAGTPLIEIVTAPVIENAKEAVSYCKTIHALVRYLGISDANMQEGSFRCDVNISLKPKGSDALGTRTELKNINSFKFIEEAIHYEANRQASLLDSGQSITQETRLYDPDKGETRAMRSKEEANDYRYFPDPDLAPVILEEDYLAAIKNEMPEPQAEKINRYQSELGLKPQDAEMLAETVALAGYFEKVVAQTGDGKITANWLIGDLLPLWKEQGDDAQKTALSAEAFAKLITRVMDNTLSGKAAKTVLLALYQGEQDFDVDKIIEAKGLKQVSDTGELQNLVDEIWANNPEQAAALKAGNEKLMAFFVGQLMKQTKGKANPKVLNELLKAKIAE